jgi:hydroxypyruvate reductase
MRPVLNVGRLPPALLKRLSTVFEVHDLLQEADPAAHLQAYGQRYEALVTNAAMGVTAAQLQALPNVRAISSFGVGLDKFDLDLIQSRGITLGYTPDVLNDCVADAAFGLVIDAMRGLSAADRFVRSGAWAQGKQWPMMHKVSGQRLGLVGFGRIGQMIAKRASGFDMAMRYHTRRPVAGFEGQHESSLTNLARWCDCLVLICAGGPATHHLVNVEVLEALGPKGYLVNAARGTVVDEVALLDALREGRIAGAGLDVFEDEPRVPSDFFAVDNVVMLPHIASNTVQTRAAMADRVFDNLEAYFQTGQMLSAA